MIQYCLKKQEQFHWSNTPQRNDFGKNIRELFSFRWLHSMSLRGKNSQVSIDYTGIVYHRTTDAAIRSAIWTFSATQNWTPAEILNPPKYAVVRRYRKHTLEKLPLHSALGNSTKEHIAFKKKQVSSSMASGHKGTYNARSLRRGGVGYSIATYRSKLLNKHNKKNRGR